MPLFGVNMTAQEEFDQKYISSREICRVVGVTRAAVIQAKQKGILPEPISVEQHISLWLRADVQEAIDSWIKRRNARIGVE